MTAATDTSPSPPASQSATRRDDASGGREVGGFVEASGLGVPAAPGTGTRHNG